MVSMETNMISMETIGSPAQAIPELESHLGYWLRRVSNAVSGGFARALEQEHTSVAEWVVLHTLYKQGQAAPGEVAEKLGLTRGAVSKIVDKLEAKGWVQMRETPQDNRFRALSLTRAGRRVLPILAQIADRNDAGFFGCLDAQEKVVLEKLLTRIAEHSRIYEVPTE
jgi:DNA-binding MarR family transcriptional regulator